GGSRRWRGRAVPALAAAGPAARSAKRPRRAPGRTGWRPCLAPRYVWDYLLWPAAAAFLGGLALYPFAAQMVAANLDKVALEIVRGDVSQFMQNFFNYNGLLFSFFASTTYSFLYGQQESLYLAMYAEVSEARSLVEQLTLVSQGRPKYKALLESMQIYMQELLLGVRYGCPPAVLLSAKPVNDPLENILYLTSIGTPSVVYDTVRSLRQARGARLGATQRKLPDEHFVLLCVLGALELLVFPLLGAGMAGYEEPGLASAPGHLLSVQACIFAALAAGVVLTLQIIQDLRSPTAGLYSLDVILEKMVQGMREELDRRIRCAPKGVAPGVTASEVQQLTASLEAGSGDLAEARSEGLLRSQLQQLPEPGLDAASWASFQPMGDGSAATKLLQTAGVATLCALVYPLVVDLLEPLISKEALLAIREDNNAQWLQNFFTGIGFIFSLFVAQTFGFLYSQQEQLYLALYSEVSEAKALLEQLSLVCRTRPFYRDMLQELQKYVRGDLEQLGRSPAGLLAGSAGQRDPLESVLYATSVGVPGAVYETVKGLRQARGARLGALQKKLPEQHFALLAILGALELSIFPVLSVGCAALDSAGPLGSNAAPGHITFLHAVLFGVMTFAVTLTLLVLRDLYSPVGDTYNMSEAARGDPRLMLLFAPPASPPCRPAPPPPIGALLVRSGALRAPPGALETLAEARAVRPPRSVAPFARPRSQGPARS
ncbi:unnamed protein product, partial [Prorocentrum cordatum]